ncbi:MAG TPA: glycosyltransferase family 2 protein [Tepidisphaeraceae bacterium]|nr:glycosyltransferase family 2 protein [Tepidisphaeraceae bacterium]
MPADPPEISIIIVSFNTRELTLKCLAHVQADSAGINAEVIVVDNASTDGSSAAIRSAYPEAAVIDAGRNLGFAGGNNVGMAHAKGEFFLLLNSDAFLHPGAIQAMTDYLRAHSTTALVGPRLLNADGTLQLSCYRFPSPARAWAENLWLPRLFPPAHFLSDYRRWPHDREMNVDWVIGACFMVRRNVYETLGGFDERFFMYAEETDWQQRMRQGGWQIGFTPAALVTHLGGASGANHVQKINAHFFDSLDFYQLKHHGIPGLIMVRLAMIVGGIPRLAGWSIFLAFSPARRAVAKAKVRLLSWLLLRQLTHWEIVT